MEEFELEPGERVILHVRKHWFILLATFLPFVLLALVPLLFPVLVNWIGHAAPQARMPSIDFSHPWARMALGLWWLILWIGAFNAFTRYFLNVWVITNQRIVEISQYGYFDRQVASFLLARVQDVTTTVDGFFDTIFGFGTVRVETAGDASRKFAMAGVRDPQGMRDLIMREIALLHGKDSSSV